MNAKQLTVAMLLTPTLGALAWLAPADAGEPCCAITKIDAKTQIVSAKETNTPGRTFQFKVADAMALKGLKVGQAIHADFKAMKVSLNTDGGAPCCAIINLPGSIGPLR